MLEHRLSDFQVLGGPGLGKIAPHADMAASAR